MYENNIFLTLTYDEEHLESPWLNYEHYQTFIKDLRDRVGYEPEDRISYMVTGEYGEKYKRPHWHAIIFNYAPTDAKHKYTTERQERVFTSDLLTKLWGRGAIEYGDVTLDSAGYVARYAAKKLVHGDDQSHPFHPIHKTSKGRAIGRCWIERNYKHTFLHGFVVLPDGKEAPIPRYYTDWLKKYKPEEYYRYVTQVLPRIAEKAEAIARQEELEYLSEVLSLRQGAPQPLTRSRVKQTILESKFKQLQENLKL